MEDKNINETILVVKEEYEKKLSEQKEEYERKLEEQKKTLEEKRIADIRALISGRKDNENNEKKPVEENELSFFETELNKAREILKLKKEE